MSHNRILATLQKVEPTKTVLVKSFPCEKKAAYLRNQAVTSMDADDGLDVALRYIQSEQSEKYTSEATYGGAVTGTTLMAICYFCDQLADAFISDDNSYERMVKQCFIGLMFICAIPFFINCMVNINNTKRHQETKEGCEEWLEKKVGNEALEKIKKLNYAECKSTYESIVNSKDKDVQSLSLTP